MVDAKKASLQRLEIYRFSSNDESVQPVLTPSFAQFIVIANRTNESTSVA